MPTELIGSQYVSTYTYEVLMNLSSNRAGSVESLVYTSVIVNSVLVALSCIIVSRIGL